MQILLYYTHQFLLALCSISYATKKHSSVVADQSAEILRMQTLLSDL